MVKFSDFLNKAQIIKIVKSLDEDELEQVVEGLSSENPETFEAVVEVLEDILLEKAEGEEEKEWPSLGALVRRTTIIKSENEDEKWPGHNALLCGLYSVDDEEDEE